MTTHLHHSTSIGSSSSNRHSRSPSPPSQTFHPSLVPKPSGLLGSAAGGAHYSGAKVHHRRSDVQRASFGPGDAAELSEQRRQVVDDLKELYSCRPSPEIFHRSWNKDAVFEDSLTHCKGLHEIISQWYAMPKIFSKSETVESRVLSSMHHPNRIICSQTQQYTLRLSGSKRTIKSILIVDLDDEDKIVRLETQWNGEEPPTAWGMAAIRRLNGKFIPWLVRLPKGVHKSD